MSVPRGARTATPLLFRTASSALRQQTAPLSRRNGQLAILLTPRRQYSSEPSTSHGSGGPSFPPPGFNSEQAKRPLPQEQKPAAADAKAGEPASQTKPASSADAKDQSKAATSSTSSAADQASLSEAAATKSNNEKQVEKKKEEAKKLSLWGKVKKEAAHYWDGTKLLAAETRISFKLALKMAAGYELTRREHRQVRLCYLLRTSTD